jgi:hypothetical protein
MKKLLIGTKVFDIRFGWGEVANIYDKAVYQVTVKFEGSNEIYTQEGLYRRTEKYPTLSLTEYTLEKGGFTPITEYEKPKVGDRGYFWDVENDTPRYGLLKHINESHIYPYTLNEEGNRWRNFSHEIPQEYIDYLNTLK